MPALGALPEGAIVNIAEDGVLKDFIIAQHGYPSAGNGRTLLVKMRFGVNGHDINLQWHSSNVNAYATSTIDDWLNSTYLARLPYDVQSSIAAVSIPYTPGNGNTVVTAMARKVFLLSTTELGRVGTNANVEGSALRTVVDLRIESSYIGDWTRSPNTSNTTQIWFRQGTFSTGIPSNYAGIRPSFTLPSTFELPTKEFSGMLQQAPLGTTVFIEVDNKFRRWMVVHQGSPSALYNGFEGNTVLLMRDIHTFRAWDNGSAAGNYGNSAIGDWLNSTFYESIESRARAVMQLVRVPFRNGSGTSTTISSGNNGLQQYVFLPAAIEVGFPSAVSRPSDGVLLSYFRSGDTASQRNLRIAYRSDATSAIADAWFSRSPNINSMVNNLNTVGSSGEVMTNVEFGNLNIGIRPALVLPNALNVSDGQIVTKRPAIPNAMRPLG